MTKPKAAHPSKEEPEPRTLCEEHRGFVPLIGAIETIEGEVGALPLVQLRGETASVHEGLAHGLIPHAVGEGRTVFPTLRRVTGSSEVAREMNRQHQEIARLTDELDRLGEELGRAGLHTRQERELRRLLHELRSVVREHFEHEEQVCMAVLQEELSPEEAREMFEAMDRAAEELRALYE